MTKAELIEAMAAKSGLTKADSSRALEAFMSAVAETLQKREKITLTGFGSFGVSRREAREEKNEPQKTDEVNEENKEINIDSLKLDEEKPNLDVVMESLTPEKNSDNLSGSDLEDIIYINVPANPTKIANSSKQKQEVILNVWKKYYVKKTILKQSEKKQNVTSDNIVPLDSLFSVPNEKLQETKDKPITNIQSFLSNAA